MARFGDLPLEVVLMIMQQIHKYYDSRSDKQLGKYALINRQCFTATNRLIWSTARIATQSQFDKFFTSVTESKHASGRHVRDLIFYHVRSDRILLLLLPHFVRLTNITLRTAKHITDTSIRQLPRYCPDIKSLTLVDALISNQSIQSLADHCSHLTKLHLHNCPGLNGDLFSSLAACSTLTTLDIEVASSTKSDWLTTDATLLLLTATRLQQLTNLRLMYAPTAFLRWLLVVLAKKSPPPPPPPPPPSTITITTTTTTTTATATATATAFNDNSLTQSPHYWITEPSPQPWPHLVSITLGDNNCSTIGDREVIALMQARPGLTELSFSGTSVTDNTLDTMGALMNGLQSVTLKYSQHITARGVRRLIQWCPLLNHGDFTGCQMLYNYQFPELQIPLSLLSRHVQVLKKETMDAIRLCEDSDPGALQSVGRGRVGIRHGIHGTYDGVVYGDYYGNDWDDMDPRDSWLWQLFQVYR